MAKLKNKSLRAALLAFGSTTPHLGEKGTTSTPSPSPEQLKMLHHDLRRISKSNEIYFQVCVVILIALFIGVCIFAYRSIEEPRRVALAFSATGVSIMGLFTQMVRLWKEKVNSDLLLALAGNLSAADMKKVVDTILRSYLKKK